MGRATFDFSGESVLVTGTGRGFGRVLSLAFAAAGARVAMCDIEGEQNNGLYGATKGGVNALTKSAAVQVAREGIRIKAIASALHDTPNDVWHRFSQAQGLDFDHFMNFIPTQRYGSAAEIAGATMFLCSNASGFVVGEVLVCDGGWMISAPGSFG